MTRRAKDACVESIIERIFLEAETAGRHLGADELMRAIGLKRTSINSTYSHVNERRKRHNATLIEAGPLNLRDGEGGKTDLTKLRSDNARLRREIQAERKRSEQYAKVIRQLALEVSRIKHEDETVTDARSRFGAT